MFSTMPSTGMLTLRNMAIAFTASISATSCGVHTTTAPGERQRLRERQRDVARARRHVDDQVIEIAPGRVAQELRDGAVQHRPAPHDRFARRHEEAHAHHRHARRVDGLQLPLDDHRPAFEPEQMRDAGAVDVGVHEAHFAAGVLQRDGERRGDGALADAALARADGDHALGREADRADRLRRPTMLDDFDVDLGVRRQPRAQAIDQLLPRLGPQRRRLGGERHGDDRRAGRSIFTSRTWPIVFRSRPVSGSGNSASTASTAAGSIEPAGMGLPRNSCAAPRDSSPPKGTELTEKSGTRQSRALFQP